VSVPVPEMTPLYVVVPAGMLTTESPLRTMFWSARIDALMSISATVVTGVVVEPVVLVSLVLVAVLPLEVLELLSVAVLVVVACVAGLAAFAVLPLLSPLSPPPQALSVEIKAAAITDGIWILIFMTYEWDEIDISV
jgi:hypothetical protein